MDPTPGYIIVNGNQLWVGATRGDRWATVEEVYDATIRGRLEMLEKSAARH